MLGDDSGRLGLVMPGVDDSMAPTHRRFGQLSSLVGAPGARLRRWPAPRAGINLKYSLSNHRAEQIRTLEAEDGRTEPCADPAADNEPAICATELFTGVHRNPIDGKPAGYLGLET